MRAMDIFRKIQGCPIGTAYSLKMKKCLPLKKDYKSQVMAVDLPERSHLEWEGGEDFFPILTANMGDEFREIRKGTLEDFKNSGIREFVQYTNQPVPVAFTIGADILHERELPGILGDYRSPPWCIPVGEACYNRESLYEITEEILGLPIIVKGKKGLRLNNKLFGKKVSLKGWISIHPESYATLRIEGKHGINYVLWPQHVYGGPIREEILSYIESKKKPSYHLEVM